MVGQNESSFLKIKMKPALSIFLQQLACGSQTFIRMLLFDPSMSALSLLPASNSSDAAVGKLTDAEREGAEGAEG